LIRHAAADFTRPFNTRFFYADIISFTAFAVVTMLDIIARRRLFSHVGHTMPAASHADSF